MSVFYWAKNDIDTQAKKMDKLGFNNGVVWIPEELELNAKQPCAYIMEFFAGQELKYLKVGQTKNAPQRMAQYFNSSHTWRNEVNYAILRAIIPCQSEAESLLVEAQLRYYYATLDPTRINYIAKDRFTHVAYREDVDIKLALDIKTNIHPSNDIEAVKEKNVQSTINAYKKIANEKVEQAKKEADFWKQQADFYCAMYNKSSARESEYIETQAEWATMYNNLFQKYLKK